MDCFCEYQSCTRPGCQSFKHMGVEPPEPCFGLRIEDDEVHFHPDIFVVEGMNTESGWDKDQVKLFAKSIKKDLGQAWDFMVPKVREAMVDSFIMRIIFSQRGDVPINDVKVLRQDLLVALDLAEAE